MNIQSDYDFFGKESISKILLKISPPVMLAQLIQALYNIVDSFFVGRYSADVLTAVTVIYPMQLIIIALAVGTGVGVNTYMSRKYAQHDKKTASAVKERRLFLFIYFLAYSSVKERSYLSSRTDCIGCKFSIGNTACNLIENCPFHSCGIFGTFIYVIE